MRETSVYLKPNNIYAYKREDGEIPLVVGVVEVAPTGLAPRLCYKVEYESDGKIDYVPISCVEDKNYTLVTD